MRFGEKEKPLWHNSSEIGNKFSGLLGRLNRLLLLESVWNKMLGAKGKFWVLSAAQGGAIIVKASNAAARHELLLREKKLISDLNKYFDKPWIKQIKFTK
jgi:hypothetical protein